MPRMIYCYVFSYRAYGDPHLRGRLFCSPECGNNTLADPPENWSYYRHRVAHDVAIAISCEGCGLTLTELREMEAADAR